MTSRRTMSKADFALAFRTRLSAAFPAATISVAAGADEITMTLPGVDGKGDGVMQFSLDNTYAEYLNDESDDRDARALDRITRIAEQSMATIMDHDTELDYEAVKDQLRVQLGWPVNEPFFAPDGKPISDPRLQRPFMETGAVLRVAIDYPDRLAFATERMAADWGIDHETIWTRAMDQTRAMLAADEPLLIPIPDNLFEFVIWTDTGAFDATRIVFPELLETWRPRHDDEATLMLAHDRDFFCLVRFRGDRAAPWATKTLANVSRGRRTMPRRMFPTDPFFLRADGEVVSATDVRQRRK